VDSLGFMARFESPSMIIFHPFESQIAVEILVLDLSM